MSAKETCPLSGTMHNRPISEALPVNTKGFVSGFSHKGALNNSRINLCALCGLSRTLWRSWQGAALVLQHVHGWLCGQVWGWPGCHHPSPTSPTAWACTNDNKAWTWEQNVHAPSCFQQIVRWKPPDEDNSTCLSNCWHSHWITYMPKWYKSVFPSPPS